MAQTSLEGLFREIAAAIREKDGSSAGIAAEDFPARIRALQAIPRTHIYGVVWDGSSSTVLTRTDDAESFPEPEPAVANGAGNSPFDLLLPWSGMTVSEDDEAGTLVAIPRFWYKWTQDGAALKLQIADGPVDGFSLSPAHADRGDGAGERDVVYVGRYHCAGNTYRSVSGAVPANQMTRASARSAIHSLGTAVWQSDFALFWTIRMLYLVEYADMNSQAKIGAGCASSANMGPYSMGDTDGMRYHTGTDAADRNTYGHTQYRNIEGLWDNVGDWIDGCYYNSGGLNVILNPNSFSDTGGGILVGRPANGWALALTVPTAEGLEWALYASAAGGNGTTYIPDTWLYKATAPCVYGGGDCFPSENSGLFHVGCGTAAGSGMANLVGCRLMKLP